MGRQRRQNEKGKPDTVWHLTKHESGYIRNRKGYAELRYGPRFSRSLGMEFVEKNRSKAIQLANQIVSDLKRQREGLPTNLPTSTGGRTVRMAWNEFHKAQVISTSPSSKLRYRYSFKAFYPSDLPLDFDRLHDHLAERMAFLREEYENNTVVKWIGCQRKFFEYCRDRGFLRGNPLNLIHTPKLKKKEKIIVYSEYEEQRIVDWFLNQAKGEHRVCRRNRTSLQYVNLWRFLACSACRIGEALSLLWPEHVTDWTTDNYVDLENGRLVLNTTKTGEERVLPIDLLPGLRATLERQREFLSKKSGHVFPWRCIQSPAEALGKCIDALANESDDSKRIVIVTGPRPLHVFRATAEARWLRLGWPENVITALAGHTNAVYRRDYKLGFDYDEVVARIPKEREVPRPGTPDDTKPEAPIDPSPIDSVPAPTVPNRPSNVIPFRLVV